MAIYQITHYLTADQKAPYAEWFRQLRDSRAKVAIIRRIERAIDCWQDWRRRET